MKYAQQLFLKHFVFRFFLALLLAFAHQGSSAFAQNNLAEQRQASNVDTFVGQRVGTLFARHIPGSVIEIQVFAAIRNSPDQTTNVVLSATVPAKTRMFAANGVNPGWSCPHNSPSGTICTKTFVSVSVVALSDFYVKVDDNVTLPFTHITSIISATAVEPDPDLSNNISTLDIPLDLSNLVMVKSAQITNDLDNNNLVTTGEEIAYRIKITNTGVMSASGVMIDDGVNEVMYNRYAETLTETITTTLGTIEVVNVYLGSGVSATVPIIQPGQSMEISFRVRVNADLPTVLSWTLSICDTRDA